jgi:hypothetical protein
MSSVGPERDTEGDYPIALGGAVPIIAKVQ